MALGLQPIDWSEAIRLTDKPAPFAGEVLDAAFNHAQAVVVLLTPDETAWHCCVPCGGGLKREWQDEIP